MLSEVIGIQEDETYASANDDDVGLGVGVQILEVATSHSSADCRLTDRSELEVRLPFLGELSKAFLSSVKDWDRHGLDGKVILQLNSINWLKSFSGCWWRHGEDLDVSV